jgi:hypothetical protein
MDDNFLTQDCPQCHEPMLAVDDDWWCIDCEITMSWGDPALESGRDSAKGTPTHGGEPTS